MWELSEHNQCHKSVRNYNHAEGSLNSWMYTGHGAPIRTVMTIMWYCGTGKFATWKFCGFLGSFPILKIMKSKISLKACNEKCKKFASTKFCELRGFANLRENKVLAKIKCYTVSPFSQFSWTFFVLQFLCGGHMKRSEIDYQVWNTETAWKEMDVLQWCKWYLTIFNIL